MKKLLPIILAAVMLLAALTACSEPGNIDATEIPSSNTTAAPMDAVKSTPEPEIKTTAEPTEKPTKDPTVSTVHYNKKECDALRKFFDAPSGVEGLSNGKLLNPDYVSEDPSTWCNSEEGRAGNSINIEWTDDGHVYQLGFGASLPETKVSLGGELEIVGFERLGFLFIDNVYLEKITLRDCPRFGTSDFATSCISQIDISSKDGFCRPVSGEGSKMIRWACLPDWDFENLYHNFEIILTAEDDGSKGLVRLDGFGDYRDYLYCTAVPLEGYRFVGWYDEKGHLVSTDLRYDFPYDENYSFRGTFNFTARFTEE